MYRQIVVSEPKQQFQNAETDLCIINDIDSSHMLSGVWGHSTVLTGL